MNVDNICEFFKTLPIEDLNKCKDALLQCILVRKKLCVNDFFTTVNDFVEEDSHQFRSIISELERLNLKATTSGCSTKWLTTTGETYVWSSAKGNLTVKQPVNMSEFPGILHLMSDINMQFKTKLNSCLVSYYVSGESTTRFHSDDEDSLDQSQGIYVVSLGTPRIFELKTKGIDKRKKACLSHLSVDRSLYVMKPGCQEHFVHRIRGDKNNRGQRYSLSFRCMTPNKDITPEEPKETAAVAQPLETPSAEPTVRAEPGNQPVADSQSQRQPIAGDVQTVGVKPSTSVPPLIPNPQRFKPKVRRTTVLFGTSITKYIRSKHIGLRGRKCANVSQSGAKIKDVIENVRDFYENDIAAKNDDIEKVIFSLGTNDIKHSRNGVLHLRKYLLELTDLTKALFPHAIVLFQSCLPIECSAYPFVAYNVVNFNAMLKDLCLLTNCVYVDCFRDFLTRDCLDLNRDLYFDWLHLNQKGLSVLSTWIKFLVNENSFDRIVDNLLGI